MGRYARETGCEQFEMFKDEFNTIDECYNRMMSKVEFYLEEIRDTKWLIDNLLRETKEETGYDFKSEVNELLQEVIKP